MLQSRNYAEAAGYYEQLLYEMSGIKNEKL